MSTIFDASTGLPSDVARTVILRAPTRTLSSAIVLPCFAPFGAVDSTEPRLRNFLLRQGSLGQVASPPPRPSRRGGLLSGLGVVFDSLEYVLATLARRLLFELSPIRVWNSVRHSVTSVVVILSRSMQ